MNAAKNDEFAVGRRRLPRQAQRIAGQIGVAIHIGALIMMRQHDGALAQPGAGFGDAGFAVVVWQTRKLGKIDDGGLHFRGVAAIPILAKSGGGGEEESRDNFTAGNRNSCLGIADKKRRRIAKAILRR